MQPNEIQQLAQQGNPQAIAEVLKAKFKPFGIRVMVKLLEGKHINIVFEGMATPDQSVVQKALQPLQQHWQKHLSINITAVGRRFGEIAPDWQWAIATGLLSPAERQQTQNNVAQIQQDNLAKQHRSELAKQLQNILKPYLWHSQVTQLNHALVIKLNVIEDVDRNHCRQVIQKAIQSIKARDIRKIYLNVYHRRKKRYLWKEVLNPDTLTPTNLSSANSAEKRRRSPTPETIQALLIGFGLSLVIYTIPLSRFVLNAFLTFVHELGHAAAFWVFGYPAVPSFDFIFGGGITLALNQVPILAIAVYGLLGYVAFLYRRNRNTLIVLCSIAFVHLLCLFSPWHEAIIIAMGHIAELLTIFICGYFALGKYFCYVGGEQTIYAMLAGFSFLETCSFFGRLIFSDSFRIIYRAGKGGLLDNDLVRLANNHLPFGLEGISLMFLATTIIMPIATWCAFYYEPVWIIKFYRLCQRSPESNF